MKKNGIWLLWLVLFAFEPQTIWTQSEQIVFVSNRNGQDDIFSIAPDGSNLQQLTDSPANETCPKWSPDGRQIIYTKRRNQIGQIYLMRADGSNPVNLSKNNINELDPVISPDGQWIAFSSKLAGNYHLHIMDINGQQRRQLTFQGAFNGRPDWSADGSKIVFLSFRNENYELYTIHADGSNLQQITSMSTEIGAPSWSPTGYHIIFHAHENDIDYLFRIKPDGSNLQKLSENQSGDFHGSYNGLGNQIVFTSFRDGQYELYTADLHTGEERRLTNSKYKEDQANWFSPFDQAPKNCSIDPPLPSNVKIAFTSWRGGSADIYLMNPDGSALENITQTDFDNSYAEWANDGKTLHFLRSKNRKNFEKHELDLTSKVSKKYDTPPLIAGAKFEQLSPNGRYNAYLLEQEGVNELYLYDQFTHQHKAITENRKKNIPAHSVNHAWSPDGQQIAFMSGPDWYNQFLKIYDLKSGKIHTITKRGYMNSGLLWIKNNRQLIINIKIRDTTKYELWSINTDGSMLQQLTHTPLGGSLHPSISPDGNWILFESQKHGDDGELYIMRPDGSNPIRLTYHPSFDGRAIWFPLPE